MAIFLGLCVFSVICSWVGMYVLHISVKRDEKSDGWLERIIKSDTKETAKRDLDAGIANRLDELLAKEHRKLGMHLQGYRFGMTGDFSNISGNCSWIKGDCTNLRGDVTNIRGDVTNLRGDCTNLRGDVTNIHGDVTNLWGDCTRLNGDCSSLKGCCTNLVGDRNHWFSLKEE